MKITVKGQQAIVTDDFLVANSVGIYECEFEFDSAWDGFAKNSVWQLNNDEPKEAVISSGVAEVPWEVLVNGGFIRVGVYGTKDEKVMPTVWGEKRKVHLGTPTGSIGTEPTPSIYAQILEVANEAKDIAEDIQTEWESVTAEAETLPSGSSASVEFEDNTFTFGIPQGERGGDGEDGFSPIVAVTPITNGHRVTITDAEGVHTFDVLDGTDGADGVGITNIVMNADYTLTITLSNGTSFTTPSIRGEQGEKGDTGNGIASIAKTATVGKVDTYTITYTDGTTTTFDVTNGEVTEESLEEALIDKADIILNSASGSIASFDDGANMPVKSLEVEINAVQSGSGDPSPTNVRPISGWDAVNVLRTGKNLFDASSIEWTGGYLNDSGDPVASTTSHYTQPIKVKPSTTYTVSGSLTVGTLYYVRIYFRDDNGNWISRTASQISNAITFTTPSNCRYIQIQVGETVTLSDAMLEEGSTATTYEAYGTTYPITLPSTVYGGKLDVVSGVLTVTHGYLTLANARRVNFVASSNLIEMLFPAGGNADAANQYNAISNMYKFANPQTDGTAKLWGTEIDVKDSRFTDEATARALLADFMAVYKLANPIEITLSDYPTIETLKGVNNLWADSGDVAVIYRADTKAYIDGTIVDVPLAMIAPIENGTKSSKAYAVGEYFILNGNQFCKAKTSIASGATFTLNTNYTVTTIATELKALQ